VCWRRRSPAMACHTSGSAFSMGFMAPSAFVRGRDAQLRQLAPEVVAPAVDDAVPAAGAGGLDVGGQVVDEETLLAARAGQVLAVLVAAPVGLAEADLV